MTKILHSLIVLFLISLSAAANAQSSYPILPGSTLSDPDDNQTLRTWLEANGPAPSGTLLYRRSTHGASSSTFHSRVDNQGPTIVLFKTNAGTVFGGYSPNSWSSTTSSYLHSDKAFLFNLNTNRKAGTYYPQYSIYTNSSYGPTFGGGHDIYLDASMNSGYFNVHSYNSVDGSSYRSGTALNALTGVNTNSTYYSFGAGFITEVEVYKIEYNTSVPIIKGKNATVYLNTQGEALIAAQDIDNGTTDPDGPVTLTIDVNRFTCSSLGGNSTLNSPQSIGTATQNPHSVGAGYNPTAKEYWYPEWSGSTVYRYSANRQLLGTFNSGQNQMMQLWMDLGSSDYYTANWNNRTATRRRGSSTVWTYSSNYEVAGITTDATYAYVLQYNASVIAVLNKETGQFVKNLNLPGIVYSVGGMVQANGKLYITGQATGWGQINYTYGSVHIYDIATQQYQSSFPSGLGTIYGVAFDGETLWFNDTGDTVYGHKVSEGNAYGSSGTGTNSVKLTATDPLGNASSLMFSVTVKDSIAPTLALNGNNVVNISQGAVFTDAGATASDNCSAKVIVTGSVNTNIVGTYTLSYKAVDVAGNSSPSITRTVKVGFVDNIPPTVITKNIRVKLDSTGNATITPEQVDNGSSDNLKIVSLTLDKSSFNCSNLGANTVILKATDSLGNSASKSAVVTITDSIAPVRPVLANVTAECSATVIAPVTIDNCSGEITGTTTDALTYTTQGTHVINWTFRDASGNTTTAEQKVIIQDITQPAVTSTQTDVIVALNSNGTATLADYTTLATATDNCSAPDAVIFTQSPAAGAVLTRNVPTVVTLTATDAAGLKATQCFTVTATDQTAPVVRVKNVTLQLDAEGKATLGPDQVDNGSTDNVEITSLSLNRTNFSCEDVIKSGSPTTPLTVVSDNTWKQSTVVTPSNEGGNFWNGISNLPALSTYTITPTLNNVPWLTPIPGTQVLFFNDNVRYVRKSINLTSVNNLKVTMLASVDNDVQIFVNGTEVAHEGHLEVENFGDSKFSQIILDESASNVNGGANFQAFDRYTTAKPSSIFRSGENEIVLVVRNTSGGDRGGISFKAIFEEGASQGIPVVLTAKDASENTSSATAYISVEDKLAPIAKVKNITVQLDSTGKATIGTADINDNSTDNCAIASLSLSKSSFSVANVGENTVTLTVTDKSGNVSTANSIVIVEDKIAPVALAKNVTIQLNANGKATTTASAVNNGSFDASGIQSLSLSKSDFSCEDAGDNPVVLTVTDINGNVATANAILTVVDSIAPIVLTQSITVQLDVNGKASISEEQINNGSSDNCKIASIALSKKAFDCSNVGANTVTLTVKDVNGNVASADAVVTVEDKVAPIVLTQNITVQLDVNGKASISEEQINNGSSDNCKIASIALSKKAFDCSNVGANAVTLTITDVNGNSSTADALVTVEDKLAPTALTRNIIVQLDAQGKVSITPGDVNDNSSDNCSISTFKLSKNDFDCSNVGVNTVTLTLTDINGNSASADAVVTVEDKTAPVALAKNISVSLVNGSAIITASSVDNGSNDACGIKSIAVDKTNFDCSNIGSNPVTLTVTDKNGNVSSASAIVTVIGIKPSAAIAVSRTDNTFTGLDSKTIVLGYGAQKLTLTASNSTSAAGATSYIWSPAVGLSSTTSASPVFTPTSAGTYTFNVLATNEFGCAASASVTITVLDVRCGNKNDKVLVCQKTGSNTNPWNQICISANAVDAHLKNGSTLGTCGSYTKSVLAGVDSKELSLTSNFATVAKSSLTVYPNPFAAEATVSFTLVNSEAKVTLDLFDLRGVKIKTLYSGKAEAGKEYSFGFDGRSVPPGTYFFKLTGSKEVLNFKVIAGLN